MIGAIDIGGTKIAAGMVDRQGNLFARRVCPTTPERGWPDALERMIAMLRETQQEAGGDLEGIGIGSTGPVDPLTGAIGTADLLPGWLGAPLATRLSQAFGVTAAMENDADSASLAEALWGLGRGAECLLYVTISTGIGVGVVNHGRLYRGAAGAHPELGHMALDASGGPLCYCGVRGCWESLASGPAMEAWYASEGGARIPAAEICRRAAASEPLALRAAEREARYLGLGLVNLVTSFCPDVIALGGGVMQSAPLFLDPAREMVRRLCTQVPSAGIRIELTQAGADAGLKGAACAWLHRYESIQL